MVLFAVNVIPHDARGATPPQTPTTNATNAAEPNGPFLDLTILHLHRYDADVPDFTFHTPRDSPLFVPSPFNEERNPVAWHSRKQASPTKERPCAATPMCDVTHNKSYILKASER